MSTAVERRALLPSPEERRELIERPFPIVYIHSVKRWAGIQLGTYPDWFHAENGARHTKRAATLQYEGDALEMYDDEI